MRQKSISLRRRQLMIAGIAAVAAPAAAFSGAAGIADQARAMASPSARLGAADGKMVVSGRILRPDGKPLSGATVEASPARGNGYSLVARQQRSDALSLTAATTDADGRFMLTLTAPAVNSGRPAHIEYRVSHPQHAMLKSKLYFIRARGAADDSVARLHHDDAGVWRATFGVTLA